MARRPTIRPRGTRPVATLLLVLLARPATARAEGEREAGAVELEARMAALMSRPGGLTAEETGKRAAATSFDVQSKQQEVEAATASVNQAVAAFFPRLGGLVRYQRLSEVNVAPLGPVVGLPPGTVLTPIIPGSQYPASFDPGTRPVAIGIKFDFPVDATTVSASLTLPISDYAFRLGQSYLAAVHGRDAARLTALSTQLKTAADARVLYYTWARSRLQTLVAEQGLAQARGHLKDVRVAFEAGAVSKADVLRVESQMAQSELLLERAENAVNISEEALRVALHDDGGGALAIGEDLNAPLDAAAAREEQAALIREALSSRPELRALSESRDSLQQQARATRAGFFPVVAGVGDVVYANPNQRIIPPRAQWDFTWDVGVQATWSPNDVALSDAGAKGIAARARALELSRKALEDGIKNEVTATRSNLREAIVALETTGRGLASSEESYRVRRSLFQNGRATSVELTDAESDLTRARFDAIDARIGLRVAAVRLDHAVGRDAHRK